ncbi:VOC family protein [Haladaptatus pallidirubidus]|uniref:VOC family protein n=1 Tax=Haladaptatus pallidirubidus TaxID=1008152 RepID=UPI00406BA147
MIKKLQLTTRIVDDQDEALNFYTEKLGLKKTTDETFGPDDQRWVTVGAELDDTVEIVLEPLDWFDGEEADRRSAMNGGNRHSPLLWMIARLRMKCCMNAVLNSHPSRRNSPTESKLSQLISMGMGSSLSNTPQKQRRNNTAIFREEIVNTNENARQSQSV